MEKESDMGCGDGLVMSATDKGKATKPQIWSIYSIGTEMRLSDFSSVSWSHFTVVSWDSLFLGVKVWSLNFNEKGAA